MSKKKLQNLSCRLQVLGEARRHSEMFGMFVDVRLYLRKVRRSSLLLIEAHEGKKRSSVLGKTQERLGGARRRLKSVREARHSSGMLIGGHGCLTVIADHCSSSFSLFFHSRNSLLLRCRRWRRFKARGKESSPNSPKGTIYNGYWVKFGFALLDGSKFEPKN